MGVVRYSGHWQLDSVASLATETTGGEILVALCPKHGLRTDLRVPNFSRESMPADSPTLFTLNSARNGRTSLK